MVRGGTGHLISAWKEEGLHPQAWAQKAKGAWHYGFQLESPSHSWRHPGSRIWPKRRKRNMANLEFTRGTGQDRTGEEVVASLFPQG